MEEEKRDSMCVFASSSLFCPLTVFVLRKKTLQYFVNLPVNFPNNDFTSTHLSHRKITSQQHVLS